MTQRLASCSCGRLRAQVVGEPVRISICHCLNCQRRTGGPFAEQARFRRQDVTPSGLSSTYTITGDEGTNATFHFCPNCGATVYYEMDAMPDFIAVPVGAFADPGFPAPNVSVYESRKHGWVVPPEGAQQHP
ncbi:MAG: GFA family protein [Rubrivivax sp.]|nr:MAG: GFA family protein [Rubrivivax sp.]